MARSGSLTSRVERMEQRLNLNGRCPGFIPIIVSEATPDNPNPQDSGG